MESSNENGWILVPPGKGYRTSTVNAKRTNNNKKAANRSRRQKILYDFFHYEEIPDEMFTMAVAESRRRQMRGSPKRRFEAREPELLDDPEKEKVQKALVEFFREGYMLNVSNGEPASDETILDYINSVLIEYGVKISGGFILKNMGMFEGNTGSSSIDIDIYLPYVQGATLEEKKERTIKVHRLLQDLFNVDKINGKPKHKYFKVTPGGRSKKHTFFQANGIYSVTKYSRGENAEMDLVQADRSTTPIQIIQRFDLSFCQNWYDGENLWSMDREAVYKRSPGRLEDTYVDLYLTKNPVTRKRIAKYMKRGFRVMYKDPTSKRMIEIKPANVANA